MRIVKLESMAVAMIFAAISSSALAQESAPPTIDDITGKWSYVSFLLDQDSELETEETENPPKKPPKSAAIIWAQGTLEMKETRAAGESNTLKGELTMKNGVKLEVSGRRAPGEDGSPEGFILNGTGSAPSPAGGQVALKYHIEGKISPNLPKKQPHLTIRGSVQALGFDPYGKHMLGAFVLTPLDVPVLTKKDP